MSTDPATPATPAAPPAGDAPLAPHWPSYTRLAAICAVAGLALFAVAGVANSVVSSNWAAEAPGKVTAAEQAAAPAVEAAKVAEKNARAAQEAVKAAEKNAKAEPKVVEDLKAKAAAAGEEAKKAREAADKAEHDLHKAKEDAHNAKAQEAAAKPRFMTAYLTGFTFWLSLPLGGLALLMIGHLVKSSWGMLLRRPLEAASRTLPLLFLLWIPLAVAVAANAASPYWWTHPHDTHAPPGPDPGEVLAAGAGDGGKRELTIKTGEAMMRKAVAHAQKEEEEFKQHGRYGFLSAGGFIGVGLVLFAIWGTMIFLLNKWGKEANATTDREKVEAALTKANKFSGPGLIVYALTITAAATQWVMSLEPGWSSTMFPVIFAVNQFLTAFAFSLALFLLIASRPPFKAVMRPKFQLDMGTLLLAFTLFWSYTSFSQFMLVWIGNLPEEIPFFLKRSAGAWWYVSAALCVFHFALPFLLLLFRDIKLHPGRLRAVAIYLLVICAIDVTWWVEPSLANPGGFPIFLMDIGAIVGIGGVWGLFFVWQLRQRPLLPASEVYRLPEGHHHEHH